MNRKFVVILCIVASMSLSSSVHADPISWSYQVNAQFDNSHSTRTLGQSNNGTAYAEFRPAGDGAWMTGSSTFRLIDFVIGGVGNSHESFSGSFNGIDNAFRIDVAIRDNATGRIATTQFTGFLTGRFGYDGTTPFSTVGAMFRYDGAPPIYLTQDGQPWIAGRDYFLELGTIHDPTVPTLSVAAEKTMTPIATGDIGSVDANFGLRDTPEPTTIGLAAGGLLFGLAFGRHRRQ